MQVETDILSISLSLIAVLASAVTTYLTFFDARYRAVAVVADAPVHVQTSSSRADGQLTSVGYAVIFTPTIILTNRGTRPVAATQIKLFQARGRRRMSPVGDSYDLPLEEKTFLLEAGAVTHVRPECVLPRMTNDFEKKSETWCLSVALIDHAGRRTDAVIRLTDFDFTVEPSKEDLSAAPTLRIANSFPRGPQLLASRGWWR